MTCNNRGKTSFLIQPYKYLCIERFIMRKSDINLFLLYPHPLLLLLFFATYNSSTSRHVHNSGQTISDTKTRAHRQTSCRLPILFNLSSLDAIKRENAGHVGWEKRSKLGGKARVMRNKTFAIITIRQYQMSRGF